MYFAIPLAIPTSVKSSTMKMQPISPEIYMKERAFPHGSFSLWSKNATMGIKRTPMMVLTVLMVPYTAAGIPTIVVRNNVV